MATVPVPEFESWQIVINSSGQSDSPGLKIGDSDNISFHNLASFPVSIQFICANGPVFNDIARINSNAWSASQTPQKQQITTDYLITDLNTNHSEGPYSVQVGVGTPANPAPLLIPISNSDPRSGQSTTAVPLGGWIQFDLDQEYTITWNPAGAFNTPLPPATIGPGLTPAYQAQTGNQATDATYSLSPAGAVGGGTVKIRS